MGREGDNYEARTPGQPAEAEQRHLWLHIPPNTQTMMIVAGLGQAGGTEIKTDQRAEIERIGLCEEVAYHASFDQYWKMPTQEALLAMPKHYNIPMPMAHRVKVISKLVKANEPKGFWLHVRLRSEEEMAEHESSRI